MSSRYRSLLLALAFLVVAPATSRADEHPRRNELSLGFGGAFGDASPDSGGLIDLHYARALSDELWLVLRPEFVLNLNSPDDTLAKQAAYGLDVGVRWHLGPMDSVHFALGLALGARGYFEPGYGGCLRLDAHLYVPVTRFLDVVISGALESGPARLGDVSPRWVMQARGDVWMGAAIRF